MIKGIINLPTYYEIVKRNKLSNEKVKRSKSEISKSRMRKIKKKCWQPGCTLMELGDILGIDDSEDMPFSYKYRKRLY